MKVLHTIPGVAQESSGPSYSVMKLVQGLRDQKVHARLRDSEFRPFAYVPSTRALIPLKIPNNEGNTIYIRDLKLCSERCLTSDPFYIDSFKVFV